MALEDTLKIQNDATRALIDAVHKNTFAIFELAKAIQEQTKQTAQINNTARAQLAAAMTSAENVAATLAPAALAAEYLPENVASSEDSYQQIADEIADAAEETLQEQILQESPTSDEPPEVNIYPDTEVPTAEPTPERPPAPEGTAYNEEGVLCYAKDMKPIPLKMQSNRAQEQRKELARDYAPKVPKDMPRHPQVPNVKKMANLPDGERNMDYYGKYIQPELGKVGEIDREYLLTHYVEFYKREARIKAQKEAAAQGITLEEGKEIPADWSMRNVPPEFWDEIVNRCRQDVVKLKAKKEKEAADAEAALLPKPPVLPEGERDDVFYAKYVRPVLKELMDIDKSQMQEIVEKMGFKSALKVPAEQWDDLVKKTKSRIKKLKGE